MAHGYGMEPASFKTHRGERRPASNPESPLERKINSPYIGPSPRIPQRDDLPAGAGRTLPSRTSLTQADIPKDRTSLVLVLAGFVAVLGFAAALVWGFVAPAVDPSVPPVAADGELPVPR